MSEDDLYDEDGEIVIPEKIDGKTFWLEDGEYLVSAHLADDPSSGLFEFGAADFNVAVEFCHETE